MSRVGPTRYRYPGIGFIWTLYRETGQPSGQMHLNGDFRRIHAGERAAVQHGERHAGQAFGLEALAASSAARVSSALICSRERASSLAWTSNSSRVTRSSLAKKLASSARRFFSASLAGLCANSALILLLNSSNKRFCCISISSSLSFF